MQGHLLKEQEKSLFFSCVFSPWTCHSGFCFVLIYPLFNVMLFAVRYSQVLDLAGGGSLGVHSAPTIPSLGPRPQGEGQDSGGCWWGLEVDSGECILRGVMENSRHVDRV